MKPLVWALGALLIVAPLTPVIAAAAPASSQVSPEALALAKAMVPRDLRVEAELREFDRSFEVGMREDKEVASLDDDYPGSIHAMAVAARPLIGQKAGAITDQAHPQVAAAIAAALTPREIAELTAYYTSPAGRGFLRHMAESVDGSEAYKAAGQGKEPPASAETMKADLFVTGMKAVSRLSPAEHDALMALSNRPVFAKLKVVQAKVVRILADLTEAPDEAYDKQLEAVMTKALEAHIAAADAKADSKAR